MEHSGINLLPGLQDTNGEIDWVEVQQIVDLMRVQNTQWTIHLVALGLSLVEVQKIEVFLRHLYHEVLEPLVYSFPMMVTKGNHEIEPQADGEMFKSYLARFVGPSEESGPTLNYTTHLMLEEYISSCWELMWTTIGQVLNLTHALWTWHRNQDIYKDNKLGDQIFVVRQPQLCSISQQVTS